MKIKAKTRAGARFFNLFAAIALLAISLTAFSCAECRATDLNAALQSAGTKVYASSAPNPAWPASQVNDGLLDTTHGWLASGDQGAAWVAFEFPSPIKISSVVFYQAGLTEGGAGRFSRPRQLRITLGDSAPRVVELADSERKPQKVEFTPTDASTVKIDVLSNYSDAKFPFLTGFQEVEIYSTDVVNFIDGDADNAKTAPSPTPAPARENSAVALPSPKKAANVSTPAPTDNDKSGANDSSIAASAAALETAVSGTLEKDGLDPDEIALLRMLHEFTAKLEEYFRKKNNQTN